MVFGIFRGTSTSRSHPAKYSPLWTPYQDAFLTTQTADDNPDEFNEVQKDLLREVLRRRRMEYLSLLLGLICGILVVVVGFLLFGSKEFQIRAPVVEFAPAMPLTTIEFTEHPELFDRPSPETDAAWDALMPIGNGFVLIPEPEQFSLKPGIPVPELGMDRFSVSMYHQLHCLRMIRNFYWNLVDAIDYGDQEAAMKVMKKQLKGKHAHHCFSYLVQGIQCSADLTIEWAIVEEDGTRDGTDGWGMPHHQCKDPKAISAWIDQVHAPPKHKTHVH